MALKKRVIKSDKPKVKKITETDLENLCAEYSRISEQIKALDKRKKELSTAIKDGAVQIGVVDDKGSYYVLTDNYVCGSVHSVTLKPNVEKGYPFLTSYKCKDGSNLKKCVKQVTTYQIDEEELGNAVQDGRIDIETVRENVYDQKDGYSVSVKSRESEEEMPEVITMTLKKAARSK